MVEHSPGFAGKSEKLWANPPMSPRNGYAVMNMACASVYNLLVDPKEEVPELNYLNDTWVDFPLYQVLEDHEASIAADPGAPDP